MSKLEEIIKGWGNYIFKDPEVEKIAKTRASICANCPLNTLNICDPTKSAPAVTTFFYETKKRKEKREQGKSYNGCACYLPAKIRNINSQCPVGKW